MIPVTGIQRLRFGIDGQGIRTLIGTAGCPLNCRYCLNPHCKSPAEADFSPFSPEALFQAVKMDNLYFQATGGGLTFGGGEPLLHIKALSRFASLCPDSWTLWAETSLQVPEASAARAADIFDHFIVDVKSMDPDIYFRYTGGSIDPVLKNLKLLLELAGPDRITVRVPVIPGYADARSRRASEDNLRALGIRNIDHLVYTTQQEEE